MPFTNISIRLPDEYIHELDQLAERDSLESNRAASRGWILQQALYGMLNGRLPVPRRRDPKDVNSKTQRIGG